MFRRLAARLRQARQSMEARHAASVAKRGAAALTVGADADQVTDFLFSQEARGIAPWQIPEEFRALAHLLERRCARTLLEIGTADGGTLFAHARLAHEEALIISLDLPWGPFGGGYPSWRIPLYESFRAPRQELVLLREDSHAPGMADLLEEHLGERRLEYAFLDGDHRYDGVRQDFELCMRFMAPDGIVVFHDIAPSPNPLWRSSGDMAECDPGVRQFWQEVKQEYRHDEFIRDPRQEGYGIGVLYLEAPVGQGGVIP